MPEAEGCILKAVLLSDVETMHDCVLRHSRASGNPPVMKNASSFCTRLHCWGTKDEQDYACSTSVSGTQLPACFAVAHPEILDQELVEVLTQAGQDEAAVPLACAASIPCGGKCQPGLVKIVQ